MRPDPGAPGPTPPRPGARSSGSGASPPGRGPAFGLGLGLESRRPAVSLSLPPPPARKKALTRRQRLHRQFQRPTTELFIGGLIIASVAVTIIELSVDPGSLVLRLLDRLSAVITVIFGVELVLRFVAAPTKRRVVAEFWLDFVAVSVSLLALRTGDPLNPLRMMVLLRLVGLLARFAGIYHYVVKRAALEVLIASGLVLLTVVAGSASLLTFEKSETGIHTYGDAFWASLFSLLAGEPTLITPTTVGGRVVMVLIMFMGMGTFAIFTGTVSAYMVSRLQSQGELVDKDELKDHLIICGWSKKAEIIASEWLAQHGEGAPPIAVICESRSDHGIADPVVRSAVYFIDDDFTKVSALERAGVMRASTCVILSDSHKARTEHDADARTILAALTVERMNPNVYTCAELNNEEYSPHLRMANVNDFVVTGEHNAYLLAQAAMNCGLTSVFSELLSHKYGNSFFRSVVPDAWVGKSFFDLLVYLKEKHDAILIAVRSPGQAMKVNPPSHIFTAGDQVVIIAIKNIDF